MIIFVSRSAVTLSNGQISNMLKEVSCSRRIFADSPPQGAPNPHGAPEEERSEPYSRSRSRSRGDDAPSDDEAYFEEEGESEAESHSLIQLNVQKQWSRQILSEEPPPTSDQNPHVFDRWCGGGADGGGNSSDVVPLTFLLADHVSRSPSWKSGLSDATLSSCQVTALRDFLVDVQPWPETAFSCEWVQIPVAHEFVALIDRFQVPVSSVGEFHIFLDGSFFPSTGASAWAFSVVLRSAHGDYFRWGFTGGLLEDSQGSLHAEAYAFASALELGVLYLGLLQATGVCVRRCHSRRLWSQWSTKDCCWVGRTWNSGTPFVLHCSGCIAPS